MMYKKRIDYYYPDYLATTLNVDIKHVDTVYLYGHISIGYADRSILYIMEKNNSHILSFDEHFDKADNVVRIHEKNYKNFE